MADETKPPLSAEEREARRTKRLAAMSPERRAQVEAQQAETRARVQAETRARAAEERALLMAKQAEKKAETRARVAEERAPLMAKRAEKKAARAPAHEAKPAAGETRNKMFLIDVATLREDAQPMRNLYGIVAPDEEMARASVVEKAQADPEQTIEVLSEIKQDSFLASKLDIQNTGQCEWLATYPKPYMPPAPLPGSLPDEKWEDAWAFVAKRPSGWIVAPEEMQAHSTRVLPPQTLADLAGIDFVVLHKDREAELEHVLAQIQPDSWRIVFANEVFLVLGQDADEPEQVNPVFVPPKYRPFLNVRS